MSKKTIPSTVDAWPMPSPDQYEHELRSDLFASSSVSMSTSASSSAKGRRARSKSMSYSKIQSSVMTSLQSKLLRRPSMSDLIRSGILKPNQESRTTRSRSASLSVSSAVSSASSRSPPLSSSSSSRSKSSSSSPSQRKGPRRLYVWGENRSGELSTGEDSNVLEPVAIRIPSRARSSHDVELAQVSLGLSHSVALTMGNQVYSCGSWISGLLGQENARKNVHIFKPIDRLQREQGKKKKKKSTAVSVNDRILSVCCADRHSVALMMSGELFTWGGTMFGKLGRDTTKKDKNGPFKVVGALAGKKVTSVDCGNCHTAVCTDDGDVYTFGGGGKFYNHGQLGQADSQHDSFIPRLVPSFGGVFILQVCCGGYHTLALSATRQVYGWGAGEFGQLGLGVESDETEPKLNVALAKIGRVSHLACGENFSLACIENGVVYSFGYGQQGQLGHGSTNNERLPRKIKYLTRHQRTDAKHTSSSSAAVYEGEEKFVIQIACGWRHSLCLTLDNKVYSWGYGDKGQLGHNDRKSRLKPTLVERLDDCQIRQIAAGGSHSLAFTTYFKQAQEMSRIVRQRSIKAKKRKGGGLGAINEDGADKNDHGNDDLGDGDLNVDLGLTGWNDGDGVDADNPLQARRDQHSANANSGGDGCAISYTGVSQHIPSYTSTLPNGRLIASLVEHMPSPHIHLAHRLITFITLAPPSFFSPLLHAYINGIRSNLLFHDAQVRPELDPDLNSSVTHYASSSSSPASSASPLRSGKQRKMLQQQQQQQYSYHRITLMMIVSPGEQEEKNHRGLATRKLKASGVLHGDADNDAGGDDDDDGTKWAERFYNAVFMPCQIKHCQLLRKHCRPCRQRRARLKRERSATHNDSNSTSHKASLHSTPTAAAGAPAGRGSVDTETRGPSNVFQAGEKEKEKASTLSSTCGTCDTQCQNVRSSMPAFREVSRKPGMPSPPLASLPPLCSE